MNVSFRMVNVFKKDADSYQTVGSMGYEEDIARCLMLARQSPAYGTSLDNYLPEVWKQLLIEKRMSLAMIEQTEDIPSRSSEWGIQPRPVGFCFQCFVRGEFYREILRCAEAQTLEPRICTRLYDQHHRANRLNKSPILARSEVAQANAREGRDGLFSFYFAWQEDEILNSLPGVHAFAQAVYEAVTEIHKGYWLEGAINEPFSLAAKMQVPRLGFQIKEYKKYYAQNSHISDQHRLFLTWVDRTMLEPGSVVYNNVTIRRPQLDLTLEQRELLEFLHQGATKSTLAEHYGTTEPAIRARLSVIYKKIRDAYPNLLKNGTEWADLSAYLKDHYEEFRPYAG